VVSIEYGQLKELLDQSQVTRDALHQMADKHEDEHMSIRGGSK